VEDSRRLANQIEARIKMLPPEIFRRYSESQEIVVFGSFAKGLQRPNSDLDIFCIGPTKTHFKSKTLEIMILPEYELYSELWLGSELANHISAFGLALGGTPEWFSTAAISRDAVGKKKRRVNAYLRSLQKAWPVLTPEIRRRYEIKVRREVQRLSLLTRNLAVPPTKLLDIAFDPARGMDKGLVDTLSPAEQNCLNELFPRLLDGNNFAHE
jgi:predicted nucleotidyltransferase